jgi:hypothetical protein
MEPMNAPAAFKKTDQSFGISFLGYFLTFAMARSYYPEETYGAMETLPGSGAGAIGETREKFTGKEFDGEGKYAVIDVNLYAVNASTYQRGNGTVTFTFFLD